MAERISARSAEEGKPTKRILSRRPGRKTAGSMISGRLVAPGEGGREGKSKDGE